MSAFTDSTRILREEKEKRKKEVEKQIELSAKAEAVVAPMEEKLKVLEERVSTLMVYKIAAESELENWKNSQSTQRKKGTRRKSDG